MAISALTSSRASHSSLIPGCAPVSRPRARPRHPTGLGAAVRPGFPSFPVHVAFPFLGARRSGFLRGLTLSAQSGGALARLKVGATWGPPAAGRRCVSPLLAAAGHAGWWERLVPLPGSPCLGPGGCESLAWVVFLWAGSFRRALTLLLPGPLTLASAVLTFRHPRRPALRRSSQGGSAHRGRFQAFSPGAWGAELTPPARDRVDIDTSAPSSRYRRRLHISAHRTF